MMTDMTSAATTDVMIVIARTTTTAMTTTARNALHHRYQKRATPTVRFKPPTEKSTSSFVVAKRPKETGRCDKM
jgi:hypothetical protein